MGRLEEYKKKTDRRFPVRAVASYYENYGVSRPGPSNEQNRKVSSESISLLPLLSIHQRPPT